MGYSTLLVDYQGRALVVTLNRPDVRNAFNDEVIAELTQVCAKEAQDEDVRVVVLKGAGKTFSAGGDLQWMKKSGSLTRDQNYEDARKLSILLDHLNRLHKPVIASVQGAALGGGMGLVSVCDYVIAAKDAQFGFTEARLGLIPATIGPFVMAKIGRSFSRAFFLSAEIFNAQRAYEIGLVHRLAENNEALEAVTNEVVQAMLSLSPNALKVAKTFIQEVQNKTGMDQNLFASRTLADLRATPEAQEGINAFLEKRKPNWIE